MLLTYATSAQSVSARSRRVTPEIHTLSSCEARAIKLIDARQALGVSETHDAE